MSERIAINIRCRFLSIHSLMRACTCRVRLEIRDNAMDVGMRMVDVICATEQAGHRTDRDSSRTLTSLLTMMRLLLFEVDSTLISSIVRSITAASFPV